MLFRSSGNGVVLTVDRTGTGGNDRTNVQFSNSGTVRGGIGTVGASDGIYFNYGTTEGMRLTSTGLGIGTSSPSAIAKLEVNGTGYVTDLLIRNNGGTPSFGTSPWIYSPASGTLAISTNAAERMRLDSSGNLGLGVTPSAWWSSAKAIDISSVTSLSGGSNFMNLMTNGYINTSGGYTYKTSTYATVYEQAAGKHIFYTAPSGTAGNAITFTQAMTLDASGNLGIGTSSPAYKLEVNGGASDAMSLFNSTNANGAHLRFAASSTVKSYIGGAPGFLGSGTVDDLGIRAVGSILFATNGSAVDMTLDSSGNLGLGVTPSAWDTSYKVLEVGYGGNSFLGNTGSNQNGKIGRAHV